MTDLIQCNRCPAITTNGKLYSRLVLFVPLLPRKKKPSDLSKNFALRDKMHFFNPFGFEEEKTHKEFRLDLCPNCTVWFQEELLKGKQVKLIK